MIDIAILLNPADYSIDFAHKNALLVGVVGVGWGVNIKIHSTRPTYTVTLSPQHLVRMGTSTRFLHAAGTTKVTDHKSAREYFGIDHRTSSNQNLNPNPISTKLSNYSSLPSKHHITNQSHFSLSTNQISIFIFLSLTGGRGAGAGGQRQRQGAEERQDNTTAKKKRKRTSKIPPHHHTKGELNKKINTRFHHARVVLSKGEFQRRPTEGGGLRHREEGTQEV